MQSGDFVPEGSGAAPEESEAADFPLADFARGDFVKGVSAAAELGFPGSVREVSIAGAVLATVEFRWSVPISPVCQPGSR